jgi:alpha-tubulin suppressor-like RCC1 family protein
MRIHFPRLIVPLKDSVIISVNCGYTHTAAITINRNILMWGSNKNGQLGLGVGAPRVIGIPTQIPNLGGII